MRPLIFLTLCGFCVQGAAGVDEDCAPVSVTEGNSVTLHTNVTTNQQDRIKWYFGKTRLAQITGGQSKICEDVQCKERFRDRLKLDQTGSLTITNINLSDAGNYTLQISANRSSIEKIVNVSVCDVSAKLHEIKRKSVKEGESVTLDPGVGGKTNDVMMWYYKDTRIAEITGDQSKICSDVECKERFRDRLKLDHQTGSLTIMNTRTTDSGEYELKINSSRISIHRRRRSITITITITSVKIFGVYVIDSSLSSGAVAGIVITVLCVAAVAAVIYCHKKPFTPIPQEDNL